METVSIFANSVAAEFPAVAGVLHAAEWKPRGLFHDFIDEDEGRLQSPP
jgi:hypothetical protein